MKTIVNEVNELYYTLTGPDEVPEGSPVRKRLNNKNQQNDNNNNNTDIIIDYNGRSESYSYEEDVIIPHDYEEDEGDYAEDYNEEGYYMTPQPQQRREHIVITLIYDDEYYKRFALTKFCHEYKDEMIRCYDNHSKYSPMGLGITKGGEYTRKHLRGLEYLITDTVSMKREAEQLQFPQIHFSERKACESISDDGLEDTYLVRRSFDYIFSHLIEIALLGPLGTNHRNPMLPDYIKRERDYRRHERMRDYQYNQCPINHNQSRCPYEWVVYTRKTGAFFQYCQSVQNRNKHVDYNENDHYLGIRPISFYLVSFLCGLSFKESSITITPENFQLVEGYDEWVQVPLNFLDLWSTRVSH